MLIVNLFFYMSPTKKKFNNKKLKHNSRETNNHTGYEILRKNKFHKPTPRKTKYYPTLAMLHLYPMSLKSLISWIDVIDWQQLNATFNWSPSVQEYMQTTFLYFSVIISK